MSPKTALFLFSSFCCILLDQRICTHIPRHSESLKAHCKRSPRPVTIIVLSEREGETEIKRERERERQREREREKERER